MSLKVPDKNPRKGIEEPDPSPFVKDASAWTENTLPENKKLFEDKLLPHFQDIAKSEDPSRFESKFQSYGSRIATKLSGSITAYLAKDKSLPHTAEETARYVREQQLVNLVTFCYLCKKCPGTLLLQLMNGDESVRHALGQHYRDHTKPDAKLFAPYYDFSQDAKKQEGDGRSS